MAKAADYTKEGLSYNGALKVLKVIMGYDYLWQNVRVKGGAYGCMSAWARTGECYMVSYRDPHLKETLDIFNNAGDYIADFTASDRDMTKYIIGTISDMDTPLTPRAEGNRGLSAYLSNFGDEDLQRERDEVLSTDVNAIRALAPFGFALKNSPIICTVGGEEKIEENKELFKEMRQLV